MIWGIPVASLTPAGLLAIAVLAIIFGYLVPRKLYLDKVKEADQWHQAYEAERTARSTSDAQTRELLEVAKASRQFLEGVYTNSEMIKSGDS